MKFVVLNPMHALHRPYVGFDRAVRDFFNGGGSSCSPSPVHMDLVRDEDAFKIVVELPGMEKDKIKIVVEDNLLTISGEKARAANRKDVVRSERFYGSFSRSFALPETIDKSGISADYTNGLLEVTLPLKEEEKPKQIDVKVK